MTTLPVHALDRRAATPLPAQLAAQVRGLVAAGTLARGHRLPGSRTLASELRVSRAVVESAYEQLLAEGWTETRAGAGTYVAAARLTTRPTATPAARERVERLVSLDTGTPWIDPRHVAGWRRAWREVATSRPPAGYDDPRGLPELREALAELLARTRGLVVDPEEVMTTAGTTDALRHLLLALGPGQVAVEDPGYRAAAVVASSMGREVVPLVPGRAPAALDGLAGCAAAYVTPAHQHPLGLVLPAPERVALLEVARASGTLVVEDDYDSQFRWDVAPVPAMAALDRDRVAYVGTASKSVAPSLRLGWLVAPREVHDRVLALRGLTHDAVPWPVQRAFVTLLRDGYVDKVVRSARRVYADRLPRLVEALSPYAELAAPPAGMYATWLMPEHRVEAVRRSTARAGFEVRPLRDYCRTTGLSGVVVGVGSTSDAEFARALDALVAGCAEAAGAAGAA